MIKYIILFLILFIPSSLFGASYYVDSDAGGGGDGSIGSPWDEISDISASAGDTVYFDNADTWTLSSGSYILAPVGGVTYDGASWGAGTRAKFVAGIGVDTYGIVTFLDDDAVEDTVITGFEIDANNNQITGVSINRPSAKSLTGATKRVENCVIHDVYNVSSYYGIRISALNDYDTSNVEVLACTVYNIPNSGIDVYEQYGGAYSSKVSNVLIRGNTVYNCGLTGVGSGILCKNDVDTVTVEFNIVHDCNKGLNIHNDGGTPAPSNIIYRYNISYNNTKDGFYFAQNGAKDFELYGNIIYGNGRNGILFEFELDGDISAKIYNNTLYNNADGEILIKSSSATYSALEIKNNIIYSQENDYGLYDQAGDITAHNNNMFYCPGGDGNVVYTNGTIYTGVNITTYEATAQSGDPNYKNTENLPTAFSGTYGTNMVPNNDGLAIRTGDAIHGGADLGASYNSSINLAGLSGDQTRTGTWDIGSYQIDPTITVTATDAAADEDGGTGAWTIACSPDCTGETVNFSYSGSATLDTDYNTDDEDGTKAITGASATITLTPVDDGDIESTETAKLTIDVGTEYSVGSPSNGDILITDNNDPAPPVGGVEITIGGGSHSLTIGGGSHSLTISAE